MLRRAYVLKMGGDTARENARKAGLTTESIEEFQQRPPNSAAARRLVQKRIRFARGAQQVITPSDFLRSLVLGWGVRAERVTTIHNGIPLADYAGLAPRWRTGPALHAVY